MPCKTRPATAGPLLADDTLATVVTCASATAVDEGLALGVGGAGADSGAAASAVGAANTDADADAADTSTGVMLAGVNTSASGGLSGTVAASLPTAGVPWSEPSRGEEQIAHERNSLSWGPRCS